MTQGNEIRLELSIPAEEALARIQAQAVCVRSFLFSAGPVWHAPKEKHVVFSTGKDRSFCMRKRHYYSNGLLPILEGQITDTEGGCVFAARFRRLKSVVWLVCAITAYFVLIGLMNLLPHLMSDPSCLWREHCVPTTEQENVLVGWMMLANAGVVFAICMVACWIGDWDKPFLHAFIANLFANVRRS